MQYGVERILTIMGIGLVDIDAKDCIMLSAHQSLSNKELSLRNKTMVDSYIGVIKRYRKELLKLSTLVVADAYFSTSTFVNGIKKEGFSLISRFRDNACLFYVYAGPRTGKRGRPKTKDGKIDMKNLDLTRTDTSLSGEEVLLYYRTRFQIDFCFQCFVHITKCCQGNYEGDGYGIFYVFIQVTDDQHLSGETNFLSKWVHTELIFN